MGSSLYLNIGRKIREIRLVNKATLAEVSNDAGISKGLLSKIENGRTIPSLPVLLQIIKALNADLSTFFEGIADRNSYSYIHKKAEEYCLEEKEESEGFSYFSIMSEEVRNITLQSALLRLQPGAQREKVVTDGFTFLYMVEGEVEYVLDKEAISLSTGDSLFFDGRIPHVPQNNSENTAVMLVIYLLTTSD